MPGPASIAVVSSDLVNLQKGTPSLMLDNKEKLKSKHFLEPCLWQCKPILYFSAKMQYNFWSINQWAIWWKLDARENPRKIRNLFWLWVNFPATSTQSLSHIIAENNQHIKLEEYTSFGLVSSKTWYPVFELTRPKQNETFIIYILCIYVLM